jgi:glutaminase
MLDESPSEHVADALGEEFVRALRFVSTGALPGSTRVAALVDEAHARFAGDRQGACSTVYPALAIVPPDLFGVCAVSADNQVHAVGDADVEFTLMSVAKPFVFALLCDALGVGEARRRIGANATGRPFNSLAAVEYQPDGRTNPMVNPGAIATTSHLPATDAEARWGLLVGGLSRFAGRALEVHDEIYASATATNLRNRAITELLNSYGLLGADGDEALDLYTRQSSLSVTARDLAVMGATLADGGMNPVTGEQVITSDACRAALTVMITAGLYETSGDWLYDVGLPGKSGIGGGIVCVAPGKGALGTFGPRLDAAGNSVKGQLAARFLSAGLGLDLFASAPAERLTADLAR